MEQNSNERNVEKPTATVLLVDDEANIISVIRRLLKSEGYRILTASSGVEGLGVLQQEKVDLVVSDMRMPQMDGVTFLAKVSTEWPATERILLTGFSDLSATVEAVNKGQIYRYVSKPWNDAELKMVIAQALEKKRLSDERNYLYAVTCKQNKQLKEFNCNLEAMVAARTEEIQQTADMLDLAYKELNHSYVHLIPVFANLVEMREGSSCGHSRRVGDIAKALAERIGLDEDSVQDIYFSALLHDIGKLGLPDHLLERAQPSLTANEKSLMTKHPVMGQAALMSVSILEDAAAMIRNHHERFDGKGYPDGLVGDAIPFGSRILAVANDFDSLQLGNLMEGVFSMHEAASFIESNSGTRYDPDVVDVFSAWFEENKEGIQAIEELALTLDDLENGMVLSRDLQNTHGILLLSKGHVLDMNLIERIKVFERDDDHRYTVYVQHN